MECGRSLSALMESKSFRVVMTKLCEYGAAVTGLTGWQYVAIGYKIASQCKKQPFF
jgi:hypothetical protein